MKGIRRIVVFSTGEDGMMQRVAEYGKKKKKKKRSRGLKTPERNVRRLHNAMSTFTDELSKRHKRSTSKKKDGWLRDGPKNTMKAQRKAMKKLRKLRLL